MQENALGRGIPISSEQPRGVVSWGHVEGRVMSAGFLVDEFLKEDMGERRHVRGRSRSTMRFEVFVDVRGLSPGDNCLSRSRAGELWIHGGRGNRCFALCRFAVDSCVFLLLHSCLWISPNRSRGGSPFNSSKFSVATVPCNNIESRFDLLHNLSGDRWDSTLQQSHD